MPLEYYKTFRHDFLNNDLVGSLANTRTTDVNEIRLIEGIKGARHGHDEANSESRRGGYINEGRQYFAALRKYQQMPQHKKEKREYYPQVSLYKPGEQVRQPDLMKIKTKTDKKTNEVTRYASFTEFKSNAHEPDQRYDVLRKLRIPEMLDGEAQSPKPGSTSRTVTNVYKRFTFGFQGMAAVTKFKTVFAGENPQMNEPANSAPLLEARNGDTFIKATSIRVMNVSAKRY